MKDTNRVVVVVVVVVFVFVVAIAIAIAIAVLDMSHVCIHRSSMCSVMRLSSNTWILSVTMPTSVKSDAPSAPIPMFYLVVTQSPEPEGY